MSLQNLAGCGAELGANSVGVPCYFGGIRSFVRHFDSVLVCLFGLFRASIAVLIFL